MTVIDAVALNVMYCLRRPPKQVSGAQADHRAGRQAALRDAARVGWTRFYLAVHRNFPLALLPGGEGLIVADRFAGEILREAPNDGGWLSNAQRTIVIDAVDVKV